jgi:pilus assembly protein CpaB
MLLGLMVLLALVVWRWLQQPRIESFSPTPSTITAGGTATLAWKTANVTSVVINNAVGSQPVTGSTAVNPEQTTTYTLTATGPGGTATARTTVSIGPPPGQKVVVAARELFWGTTLTAEMLKLELFPDTSLPAGYVSDAKSIEGRFLLANLTTNEPVLVSKLAPPGGMAAVTHQDKRAMAVKVDTIVGVAGFVKPGNRVDVLVTLRESPPITKIVLQNVLVLATGVTMERRGNERDPSQVSVITLEVTPMEAEKLALASSQGELRLALRNVQDTDPVFTPGATIPSLLTSYRSPEGPRIAQPAKGWTVEVIKGGQVEIKTLE